jgi:aryl-alcohol dehydrogenase-like predicted oxidoreductase
MRYRLFGPSGIRVSEICLGTMSFGDVWGFGADEKESHRILDTFAEEGGNFVDTANKYHEGQTEEILGRYLATSRDHWVVGTKYSLAMRSGDPNAAGNSRKNLRQSVEASLRRLGTDYLDILWVHAWDHTCAVDEVLRALDDLVHAGTVLATGFSDGPAWVVAQANAVASVRGWTGFSGLQFPYSLIDRTTEPEVMTYADTERLPFLAWAPTAAGVLTGKYTRPGGGESFRRTANEQQLTDHNLAIARVVDEVADELGIASSQVALAWLRQRHAGLIPIVGARTVEQIEETLGCTDVTLPAEHQDRLTAASDIAYPSPYTLLRSPSGQAVYGNLEPLIDLPSTAPLRWA